MKISIVIPVYNSADILPELVERIKKTLNSYNYKGELLLIDDSSTDYSWKTIIQLKKSNPEFISAIRLDRNFGQHHALLCGLRFAKGDFIITMDDDLQHPPEEIPKLINQQQESNSQLVYGLYKVKNHSKWRSFGRSFIQRASTVWSDNTFGNGSSFRLLSRSLVDKIKQEQLNFVFLDEIVYWFTTDVSGVEVEHHPRKLGKSTYTFFKLIKLLTDITFNYTALPLRLMTIGGVLLSIFTFILGIWFIIKKLYFNVPVPGYTSLIVTILFSTSIMLICFGIIGKYLYRNFLQQSGKPPYSIKEIL